MSATGKPNDAWESCGQGPILINHVSIVWGYNISLPENIGLDSNYQQQSVGNNNENIKNCFSSYTDNKNPCQCVILTSKI